jgi:hypothetical protein
MKQGLLVFNGKFQRSRKEYEFKTTKTEMNETRKTGEKVRFS